MVTKHDTEQSAKKTVPVDVVLGVVISILWHSYTREGTLMVDKWENHNQNHNFVDNSSIFTIQNPIPLTNAVQNYYAGCIPCANEVVALAGDTKAPYPMAECMH